MISFLPLKNDILIRDIFLFKIMLEICIYIYIIIFILHLQFPFDIF